MLTIDAGDRRQEWLEQWRQAVGDDLLGGYATLVDVRRDDRHRHG